MIACRLLSVKFPFVQHNIAIQTVLAAEQYFQQEPDINVIRQHLTIINCCEPHAMFCDNLEKALMSRTPILFLNYAGQHSPHDTVVMLQKISLLYLTKITKKN